jgi:hypothetical protein
MSTLLLDRKLFAKASSWYTESGDNINKPASDFFMASQVPDGTMLVTNGSNVDWGGALVVNKRALPVLNGKLLPFVGLRLKFMVPYSSMFNLARHEIDLKICIEDRPNETTSIRNVADFSTQWNADQGMFQIDNSSGQWIDTGFIVETISPDEWHTLDYRFWFDPVAKVFSVLSINYDEELYKIPANLQQVPLMNTNWTRVAAFQVQNEVYHAGSTSVVYDHGVIAWSDEAIAEIPEKTKDYITFANEGLDFAVVKI